MDKNLDRIDDYLSGNLNQEQTSLFEAELNNNPTLKEDVDAQQQIIKGVREFRKSELKSRLNALNTPSSSFAWQKLAIAASTLVLSSSVGWLVFNSDKDLNNPQEIVVTQTTPSEPINNITKGTVPATTTPEAQIEPSTVPEHLDVPREISTPSSVDNNTVAQTNNTPAPTRTEIIFPDPSATKEKQEITIDSNTEEEKGIDNSTVQIKEDAIKVHPENKKNRFHYKYNGSDVLVQIADYSDQQPAVIIDFPEKKELFLNYKGVFYQLTKNSNWDTLSKHVISNKGLIKKLREKIK